MPRAPGSWLVVAVVVVILAAPKLRRPAHPAGSCAQRTVGAAFEGELEYMRETKQPERLDPEQAEPILAAARARAAVEPENGLPDPVQFHCLYALHRDAEAVAAWERAGRRR